MKRIRVTAIVGGVVLAASLLGACSKGSSSSSTTTAANKTTTTAAAQSGPSTAMAGTNFQQFSDPSGTISCAGGLISGSSNNVTCETASKGFEAFVALTSDGTIVKTSGFQPTGPANTLPAGSMSLLGAADGKGITCKAAATAITCTANNGKGFTISTTSLTYVGGAVAAS